MTLTTHAIVGAAAAAVVPQHPVWAFVAGFVSHLAIDAIPHKDYGDLLSSFREDDEHPLNNDFVLNKNSISDLAWICFDGMLGLVASIAIFVWFFQISPLIALIGAFAGEFPDALQFLYFKTHTKILLPLQKFHIWIQQKSPINTTFSVALGLQCVLVLAVLGVVWLAN
ncbi:hypothetical protein KW798_00090 [Candidatus Parcubacteria bacterium]|nr:hypothetical protein [Candidatus Parcubacteria bacterium]